MEASEAFAQALSDRILVKEMRDIQKRHKRRYGSPRAHAELIAMGLKAGRHRAARRMRLKWACPCLPRKRFQVTTDSRHHEPVAENVLERQFDVAEPNTVWVPDIACIPTQDGWLDQASSLYANLESDEKLLQKMAQFGYTAQKIRGEEALLDALREKIQLQAKETGEAQSATRERDKKIKELDSYVSNLRAIAKVAFYDSPQELEKLGIIARSAPRKKKAEAAKPAAGAK